MEQVAIGMTIPAYNSEPPFHPDVSYPELPYSEISTRPNLPFHILRDLFYQLGYDREHFGTTHWNPLGTIIKPGHTVVIKPNFVLSFNSSGQDLFAVVSHPSIIRALIDYTFIALHGDGRIIIADAPQMDCNWEQLMAVQHLDAIQDFYRMKFGFNIEVYDLRDFCVIDPSQPGYSSNRKLLSGDPLGSMVINLGKESEFYGLPSDNYYGADYNRNETITHHRGEIHEYCVSKTILSADVFISVPKMKVHKKVGVTLNLKGLVGINTNKNYLIHYRIGTPSQGGDQLPDGLQTADQLLVKIQRRLFDKTLAKQTLLGDLAYKIALAGYRMFVKPIRHVSESVSIRDGGNWCGNDSAWRMTVDLAKILYFVNKEGILQKTPQRKIFCVIDGIIGGENNGPLAPEAKQCGCLVVGQNPFAVDMVTARLMGFDVRKIRQFNSVLKGSWSFLFGFPSEIEVLIHGNRYKGEVFFDSSCIDAMFQFKPHPGWIGQIEV